MMRLTVQNPNIRHDWGSAVMALFYLESGREVWDSAFHLAAAPQYTIVFEGMGIYEFNMEV